MRLRSAAGENERLQALWSQEVKGQLAIAEKLAELMEREPVLLAAIERAEAAQRYSEQSLQIAQSHIADLQAEIEIYRKGHRHERFDRQGGIPNCCRYRHTQRTESALGGPQRTRQRATSWLPGTSLKRPSTCLPICNSVEPDSIRDGAGRRADQGRQAILLVFIGVILWLVTDWLIPTIAGQSDERGHGIRTAGHRILFAADRPRRGRGLREPTAARRPFDHDDPENIALALGEQCEGQTIWVDACAALRSEMSMNSAAL